MNILKLQDMLKGLPDARLQQELDAPTGSVPQYLVLSEVVRRQKMREDFAPKEAPQTTVLEDARASLSPQPPQMGIPSAPMNAPAMADGGFVSPSEAFGNAGFAGFQQQPQQKPQPPMGSLAGPTNLSPQTMAPQQSYQPQPTSQGSGPMVQLQQYGQLASPQQTDQAPNSQQSFARGGAVRMADGEDVSRYIEVIGSGYLGEGVTGGATGRIGVNIPALDGLIRAGLSGGVSGYYNKTPGGRFYSVEPSISGGDISFSKDGRDYGVQYQQFTNPQQETERSLMFNYAMPFANGGAVRMSGGGQPSQEELIAYIREAAIKRGVDPDVAVRVAKAEGLGANPLEGFQSFIKDKLGNREQSYGVFQLNMKPGAIGDLMLKTTGVHPKDDPYAGIDFAMDTVVKTGWSPWMGAKAAGIEKWQGIKKDANVAQHRVANPADVEAGIGSAGQGSTPGGYIPSPDNITEKNLEATKKGKFSDFASDVGLSLMNQQPDYAPNAGMLRGASPAAAAKYGQREQELIDAYKKRAEMASLGGGLPSFLGGTGIMSLASGGPVYLAGGTPDPYSIIGLSKDQVDQMSPYDYRQKVLHLPAEKIATMTPEQVQEYYDAAKGIGVYMRDNVWSDKKYNPGMSESELGSRAYGAADRAITRSEATGILSNFVSPETQVRAAKEVVGSPEAGATEDRTVPSTGRLGSASERLPPLMAGTNYTLPPSAPAAAPGREPTELELYKEYMDKYLGMQKDYIDEQRRLAEEAKGGGFSQFLRRLGIGILASPTGRLQDALASGIRNVATAGEAQKQQYQEQMDKIRQAELQYGMESAKLPYEIAKLTREGSGAPTASEIRKFYADQLSELNKQKTEILKNPDPFKGADTSYIDSQIAAIEKMLQKYGIPATAKATAPVIGGDLKSSLGIQ